MDKILINLNFNASGVATPSLTGADTSASMNAPVITQMVSNPTQNNTNIHLINDAILGTSFPNVDTTVTRESSALIPFIQQFYKTNPSYTGGQYLFLRFSPDADTNSQAYRFYIYSANSPNYKPKLRFQYDEFTENPEKLFYRVKYGQN